MGCFSWMFADTNNQKSLREGSRAYLVLPDGALLYESHYECYGEFAGQDVFDLVADWNRELLSQNPNFLVKQHGQIKDPAAPGGYRPVPHKKISDFLWYAAYADLTKSRAEVEEAWREAIKATLEKDPNAEVSRYCEYRGIGIDLAAYDDQNAALPFPIKVVRNGNVAPLSALQELPASQSDPDQGM